MGDTRAVWPLKISNGIFATSVGKHPVPGIDAAIQEVCNVLKARLDAHYARTSAWIAEDREYLPTDPHDDIPF